MQQLKLLPSVLVVITALAVHALVVALAALNQLGEALLLPIFTFQMALWKRKIYHRSNADCPWKHNDNFITASPANILQSIVYE